MNRYILIACAVGLTVSTGAVASTTKAATKPAGPAAHAMAKSNPLAVKFAAWDSNKDGFLTQAELAKPSLSAKMKSYEAKVFASADRNHDKRLSKGEFTRSVEARLIKVEG